jgi:dsDNA-binding SOS-regulon protein
MNMSEIVTLELPEHVIRSAQAVASQTHRRVEEVLVDWIDQAAAEVPVNSLSDEQILGLCDMQMTQEDQEELSLLLARNREGQLDDTDRTRLDALMQMYRRGLVRKAKAWKVAVARGLRTALT